MSTRTGRVLRETALTLGAVLGVLCIGLSVAGWLFGVHLLVFGSGSMSPTIKAGGAALAHHVPASEVHVGDIVSVRDADGVRITHRVTAIDPEGPRAALTLKGDANATADKDPYVVDSVDRVFWHANGLGFVVHAFASRWALLVTGAAAVALLFLGFSGDGGSSGSAGGRRRAEKRRVQSLPEGGSRRREARVRVGALFVAVLGLSATVVAPAVAAGWADNATVNSGSISTYAVPKPPTLGCSISGNVLSGYTAEITWTAATAPFAFGYAASIQGAAVPISSSGTTRTITLTKGVLQNLLGGLLGDTVVVTVNTVLSGGSGATAWTWTSLQPSTRTVNVSVLGLAWTCGATT